MGDERDYDILGIEPTTDIPKIQKAYAKKLKINTPEKNPEAFKEIYNAYKRIMASIEGNKNIHDPIIYTENKNLHTNVNDSITYTENKNSHINVKDLIKFSDVQYEIEDYNLNNKDKITFSDTEYKNSINEIILNIKINYRKKFNSISDIVNSLENDIDEYSELYCDEVVSSLIRYSILLIKMRGKDSQELQKNISNNIDEGVYSARLEYIFRRVFFDYEFNPVKKRSDSVYYVLSQLIHNYVIQDFMSNLNILKSDQYLSEIVKFKVIDNYIVDNLDLDEYLDNNQLCINNRRLGFFDVKMYYQLYEEKYFKECNISKVNILNFLDTMFCLRKDMALFDSVIYVFTASIRIAGKILKHKNLEQILNSLYDRGEYDKIQTIFDVYSGHKLFLVKWLLKLRVKKLPNHLKEVINLRGISEDYQYNRLQKDSSDFGRTFTLIIILKPLLILIFTVFAYLFVVIFVPVYFAFLIIGWAVKKMFKALRKIFNVRT